MKTVVQRICWNTRGWRLPAGNTDESGFPAEKGFGHEEWNFQIEDAVEGFIHGYTKSRPSLKQGDGPVFRLYFYAIHPETKERLLVGSYQQAKLIDESEYQTLLEVFRDQGILERRVEELMDVVPSMDQQSALDEITSSLIESWLTVKCPVESVQVYDPPVKIPSKIGEKNLSGYFHTFAYVEESEILKYLSKPSDLEPNRGRADLIEDAYFRESRGNLQRIIPRHKRLSNKFCKWLEANRIRVEQEKQGIDVEFVHRGKSYRTEIKITYGTGTRHSIREALGQLFEYDLYPGRKQADEWIILLDAVPSNEDREYIAHLREIFKLPLHLSWLRENDFVFTEPHPLGLER